MNSSQIRGFTWAGVAALISGTANFANGLLVQSIDPVIRTTVVNGLVGIAILALFFMNREKRPAQLPLKRRLQLLLISLVGGSVPFLLFFSGLKLVGGVGGSLIHKTLIFWILLMAVPVLKERVNWKMMGGVLLLYGSNFLMGFSGLGTLNLGHAMILGATLLWAVENIVAKKVLRDVSVNALVAARMSGGSVWLVLFSLLSGKGADLVALSGQHWLMLAGVALLLFGYVMSWYRALQLAPVSQVASILVGAVVITGILHSLLVTKVYSLTRLAQAVVIVTGVWLVVMAAMDRRATEARPTLPAEN